MVMTGSKALAGRPRAGEKSKCLHYKKSTKMKDIPQTWVLTGKQFDDFRRKKNKHFSRPFKKPQ